MLEAMESWTFKFLCLMIPLVESRTCGQNLLWDRKSYLGPSLGYDLQICCNVTKVWAAKYEKNWKLSLPPAVNTAVDEISIPGSEFILSACSDGTVSQGWVVQQNKNVTCTAKEGRVARILPSDSVDGFQTNKWYVLCYTVKESRNSECRSCSFELLCSNKYHPNCTSIWLDSATVNVSNESMTVIVRVGKSFPFPGDLVMMVQDHNDQVIFSKTAHSISPGNNLTFLVQGLMPDSWYRVNTCLRTHIPQSFLDGGDYGMPRKMRRCLEPQSHKTQSSLASSASTLPSLPSFATLTSILLILSHGALYSAQPLNT